MSDRTAEASEEVSVKAKSTSVFICSRGEKVLCSAGCGRRASRGCAFELKGKLAGKTCNAPLCERCGAICPPHTRTK